MPLQGADLCAQVEQGERHSSIYADHEVVTDTDTWFTLRIDVTEIAGSGYQYYYHIDKTAGEIAPGYMGLVEFVVDEEAVAGIR